MNSSQKRVLQWAGSTVSIAGILFIGLRVSTYSAQLDFSKFEVITWSVLVGSALVYGMANGLLALAWWNLLRFFKATPDRLWAVRIYGLTQPAKYVPGNIMHLASRQAMGMAQGVPGWSLAKSSLWELGLIFAAGMFFFILVLPHFLPTVTVTMAMVGFAVVTLTTMVGLKRKISPIIARVFGLYLVFLIISGLVFVSLLVCIIETGLFTVPIVVTFCAAFILAWVIGLLTPGAPAGIGVREMVLVALLGGSVPEADLLLTVVLSRAVTMAGDLLFFLFGLGLAKKQ